MSSATCSASLTAYCLLELCHAVYRILCCTAPVWLITCLFMPKTSIYNLMQPDCKPDQSHRPLSVRFQLVNRLHPDARSDSNLSDLQIGLQKPTYLLSRLFPSIYKKIWACRLSQGWTRTQGRLRPGSQADAASVRSWCSCRGPMQQPRRMMDTCWAWFMMLPSTKASSL